MGTSGNDTELYYTNSLI